MFGSANSGPYMEARASAVELEPGRYEWMTAVSKHLSDSSSTTVGREKLLTPFRPPAPYLMDIQRALPFHYTENPQSRILRLLHLLDRRSAEGIPNCN